MHKIFLTGLAACICALALAVWGEAAPRSELVYASTKDIRDINPHLYGGEMAAQGMVFEPLVMNTKDGIKPWLAESWEISGDGKVYTFHLRKGVVFTDGFPFNAEAVKRNIDAIIANRVRHAWLDMINEIDRTEAVDEHTFRLTLKHPYYPTLIELGLLRPFRFISPRCFVDGQTKNGVSGRPARGCLPSTSPTSTPCLRPIPPIGEKSPNSPPCAGKSCPTTRPFCFLCKKGKWI